MIKGKCKGRGTALFLVLAVVFVVVALANIILSFMHSQSRLTHHQVSRIQAYYAAQAGMNYALEQLRTGNWKAGENYTSRQGSSYTYNSTLDSITSGFDPPSINYLNVTIASGTDPSTGAYPLNITVDYQYVSTL